VTTVARWARTEVLKSSTATPGGQRRYRRADILTLLDNRGMNSEQQQLEKDTARFGYNYGTMRRLLPRNTSSGK